MGEREEIVSEGHERVRLVSHLSRPSAWFCIQEQKPLCWGTRRRRQEALSLQMWFVVAFPIWRDFTVPPSDFAQQLLTFSTVRVCQTSC